MTDELPVGTFAEAYPFLRRPFVPEAVGFKVQATVGGDRISAVVIAYIDARNVTARLNAVCPEGWSETYEEYRGGMVCHLTVLGVSHIDWGVTQAPTEEMSVKGTYSDALKRTAVRFGVGESLYATPALRLYQGPHLRTWTDPKGKPKSAMTPAGEKHCRDIYAEWLDRVGAKAFGPALDHGDGSNLSDSQILAGLIEDSGFTEEQTDLVREWAKNGNGLDPVKVKKATNLLLADEPGILLERAAA